MSKVKNINIIKMAIIMSIIMMAGMINVSFATIGLGDNIESQKVISEEADNGISKYQTPTPSVPNTPGVPTPGLPTPPSPSQPTETPSTPEPQKPAEDIPHAGLDNTQTLIGAAALIVIGLLVVNAISIKKELI